MRSACRAVIAVFLVSAPSACDGCGPAERDLWVVNNSGVAFSVAIDGKEALPSTESSATDIAPRRVKVKPGDRTLEARFADGTKVVRRVMFSQQTSGYVFAPRRDKASCFVFSGPSGEMSLDPHDEVLGLPHVVDDEHTLRMKPCGR